MDHKLDEFVELNAAVFIAIELDNELLDVGLVTCYLEFAKQLLEFFSVQRAVLVEVKLVKDCSEHVLV